MSLFDELRRRKVIRMAAVYAIGAWLILQVGDLLLDAFEAPSWVMRLVVVILSIGFPIALVVAWIFKWTPDGLRRESATASTTIDSVAAKRTSTIAIVILALVSGAFGVSQLALRDRYNDDQTATETAVTPARSVAVLPFDNISGEQADEYFSDGLAEELLNVLAAFPELRVTARTSSFSFKGKDIDVRSIGKQLNVANVLEGSVRRSGDQLRITAQLIKADTGFHLWSRTYDRFIDDVFAIQDEIAHEVAQALRVSLIDSPPRVRETNPEAFTAYLNGNHFYQQRSSEGFAKAVEYFKACLDIDPDYEPAWTALASTYANQALYGSLPFVAAHEEALVAVNNALRINPNSASAHSARAWIATTYEGNNATAAVHYKRALELSPGSAVITGNAAVFLRTLGRLDEALALTEVSLSLNPVSSTGYINYGDQLMRAGRPEDAVVASLKSLELTPNNRSATANLAFAYLLTEKPDNAIQAVSDLPSLTILSSVSAMAYDSLQKSDESESHLATLIEERADQSAFLIATVFAWRGEIDSAFSWLERSIDEQQRYSGINTDPFLRNLHDDPRWGQLLRRLELADDQLARIEL